MHAGQEKKLLRGQIIIAKVTLERAQGLVHIGLMHEGGRIREYFLSPENTFYPISQYPNLHKLPYLFSAPSGDHRSCLLLTSGMASQK